MLCYELGFTYRLKDIVDIESGDGKDAFELKVRSVNKQLKAKWGGKSCSIVMKADTESLGAVMITSEPDGRDVMCSFIKENVTNLMGAEDVNCTLIREITVKEVNAAFDRCFDSNFIDMRRRYFSELELDF